MKIRTDFVSNSSSSSFILKDVGFFEHFSISKQDIVDAIVELSGLKHGNDFFVYDMRDEKDSKECFARWDNHFETWYAPNEGECKKWEEFMHMMCFDCDISNIDDVLNGKDDEAKEIVYNHVKDENTYNVVNGGANFIRFVKSKLGVKTMKEVLHDQACTLMVHFDDNLVSCIKGMVEEGKYDEDEFMDESNKAVCKNSQYDSQAYSSQRFFEVLIKYLIDKGKVDLSDSKLMDFWLVPKNHWWKKDNFYKDRKYLTKDDNAASWEDVYDDMLNCNAIMHEG